MTNVFSHEEALATLLQSANALPTEWTPLKEAHTRINATDIRAKFDLPRFDNSAMDGYALHYAKTTHASEKSPVFLPIEATFAAGDLALSNTNPNAAYAIMTGAAIPSGCDAVVAIEQTVKIDNQICIQQPVTQHKNIRFKGEDLCSEEFIARTGDQLNAGHIAVLASFGYENINVRRLPKISLISTTSIINQVDHDDAFVLIPQQYPSMHYLTSQLKSIGITTTAVTITNETNALKAVLMKSSADMMIYINTMPNDHQTILDELHHMGAQILFQRLAQQSNSFVLCARLPDGRYFFNFPHYLSSCAVGLHFFIRPLLRVLQGLKFEPSITLPLAHSYQNNGISSCFLKALVNWQKHHVEILPDQFMHSTHSLLIANAWVMLTEQQSKLDAQVPVIVLPNCLSHVWL